MRMNVAPVDNADPNTAPYIVTYVGSVYELTTVTRSQQANNIKWMLPHYNYASSHKGPSLSLCELRRQRLGSLQSMKIIIVV